jgi:hypothetical protein
MRPISPLVAFLTAALALSGAARGGTIIAQVESAEPVQKVRAILREETSTGVHPKPFEGQLQDGKLAIANLPPGRYDLEFTTASGTLLGWDAGVPASDYEEEQPLDGEARATLLAKMQRGDFAGFEDRFVILDMQGNIQNAAILAVQLRTRPFAEGMGTNTDTWIWRIQRWQWHNPDEVTWQPYPRKIYYALVRERIKPEEWPGKAYTLGRHWGGIEIKDEGATADVGILRLPKVEPGIRAVNPDGSTVPPITIKPAASGSAAEGAPAPPDQKEE